MKTQTQSYFSTLISPPRSNRGHFSSQKGFTLLEMLISMGLMTMLIGILSGLFVSILDGQLESQATAAVDQDGRYILSRLMYDMQSASAIVAPAAPGNQSNSLQITVNTLPQTYTLDSNGNFQITNGYGTNNLNSVHSSISNLSFHRIGTGGTDDTIRVSYTVTSRIRQFDGPQYETRTFQTTLGMK